MSKCIKCGKEHKKNILICDACGAVQEGKAPTIAVRGSETIGR